MPIELGSKLGPYEIVSRLGAGGMGEVFRARDPRLGRDVAIKLLPDAFASDPERLARFEREAKLLASLQHANIAVLHGLEESDGRRFLVMQCVEGESLAQRLARGALPVGEALEIAGAIAGALEAAHEAGIVHRDLKPGNVMVTPGGDVKVLDFGLAKGGAGTASDAGLSASPTMTYAATNAGVILGTAAYMSPEQSRGKPVDRRTDIWSFGCVLFELLTGQQAFAGETVSDIVARILQTEPDWKLLPPAVPGRVRDLLVRCLQKDARRRLRDIGDARLELEDVVAGRVSASGAHLAVATTAAPRRRWLVPAIAALVAVSAAAAWFAARTLAPSSAREPVRFVVAGPRDQVLQPDGVNQALSPDGRTLAMIVSDSVGVPKIWVRRMDAIAPRLLAGTEHTTLMFWSPDSRYLAFCAEDRRLSKVALAGGDPEPLCEIKTARGGSWGKDGVILIAPYASGGLYRVSANGGDPVVVVRPDSARGETALRFPVFLPDGRHFLFSSLPSDSTGRGRICVGALDGSAPRVLLHAESGVAYAEPGWLLYTRKSKLTAQRFDPRALKLVGEPVAIGDIAQGGNFGGSALVSASRTGELAFVTRDPVPARLAWLDLQGRQVATLAVPKGNFYGPRLSPDRHLVLMSALDLEQNETVMLADLERGIVSRVTGQDESAAFPIWGPDGNRFAYMTDTAQQHFVVRSTLDDSRRLFLTADPAFKRLQGWSADGRYLIYDRLDSATKWDVWALPLEGGGPPLPLARTGANEQGGALSPDGRWVAFDSDESGTQEAYVVPFGSTGMRYQVTNGGGFNLGWSRDGRHLRYALSNRPGVVVQADVQPGATFALGQAHELAHVAEELAGADLDEASQRIIALVPAEKARPQTVTVIQNWQAALKQP